MVISFIHLRSSDKLHDLHKHTHSVRHNVQGVKSDNHQIQIEKQTVVWWSVLSDGSEIHSDIHLALLPCLVFAV